MKKIFRWLVLGAVGILVILFLRNTYTDRPKAGANKSVTIAPGSKTSDVANILRREGLISGAIGYSVYALLDESARRPKAGTYMLTPGLGYRSIARQLALGVARNETEARLIEGWTVDDEIDYLHAELKVDPKATALLTGRSVDRAPFLKSLREDFSFLTSLPSERSLEGYLFPDTYRVWEDQLPDGLIRKQLSTFGARFGDAKPGAKSAPLRSLDEVIILASIVEREVPNPADRRIVASVFLRRLREGMGLQSDATLSYLHGSSRARATAEDLASMSPYNTYKYRGLPPGPISNPAASAIEAVLNPAETNYRYFLTDPEGKVYYASTFEGHIQNRQKAGY